MNGQRLRERRQKKVELELRRGYKHTAELALHMAPKEVNTDISIKTARNCLMALHLAGASNLLINAAQDLTSNACHSDVTSMDVRRHARHVHSAMRLLVHEPGGVVTPCMGTQGHL